jgi:hypothetical protein
LLWITIRSTTSGIVCRDRKRALRRPSNTSNSWRFFRSYRACAPCYEKFGIPLRIEVLKTDTGISETFWQEYDRITEKLNAFDTIKGNIYRDLLYADLKNYSAAYHAALCYMNLNVIATESNHKLVNRGAIRALL